MVSVAVSIPATAAKSSPGATKSSNSTNNNNINQTLIGKTASKSSSVKLVNPKTLLSTRSQASFDSNSGSSMADVGSAEQHVTADNRGYFNSSQSSISSGLLAHQSSNTQLGSNANNNTSASSPLNINNGNNSDQLRDVVAEGMLCKYTNVVNGWKNRWFVLNKDVLEYYEKEDHKCNLQKPRGTLSIFAATVVPSDEDFLTFTVTTLSGQILKLKASDQRERSFWISRLRQAASTSVSSSAILWSAPSGSQLPVTRSSLAATGDSPLITPRRNNNDMFAPHSLPKTESNLDAAVQPLNSVQNELRIASSVSQAHNSYLATCTIRDKLREAIERLPNRALALDINMLQMKANAAAVCTALDECISVVRKQSAANGGSKSLNSSMNGRPLNGGPSGALAVNISPNSLTSPPQAPQETSPRRAGRALTEPAPPQRSVAPNNNLLTVVTTSAPPSPIEHDKAIEDTEKYRETGIGNVEPQRPIILQMLAELKLGMDLTRVTLPTFILEKRSLLEMFADCMGHPDLFLKIAEQSDAESRIHQVLVWYLTSIHAGRQGDISKKPYNPIIGETFHCCWDVSGTAQQSPSPVRITFTAEQVSHHPPVSAFYFECPAKSMTLNGSIWTKSQFLGMSIGAQMIGQITLNVHSRGEQYHMTLPSAYARSILSYPWVELGDRCTITCPQTGYSASIVFHTKGAYGGTLHRVSGEVHPPNSPQPSLRFSGEWTGRIDFTKQSGESFSIDVTQLQLHNKRIRPLALQSELESRRLWQSVTHALKNGDVEAATAAKKQLEEQQRHAERLRRDRNIIYEPKYFDRMGNNESAWIFKYPLRPSVSERQRSSPQAPSS